METIIVFLVSYVKFVFHYWNANAPNQTASIVCLTVKPYCVTHSRLIGWGTPFSSAFFAGIWVWVVLKYMKFWLRVLGALFVSDRFLQHALRATSFDGSKNANLSCR